MGIPDRIVRKVRTYCREHGVKSLFLLGSCARGDATDSSDIDLLVEFQENIQLSYLDLMLIKSDLEGILGSEIDLVEMDSLVNPIRRKSILSERIPLFTS